jgi:LysM repeat protein
MGKHSRPSPAVEAARQAASRAAPALKAAPALAVAGMALHPAPAVNTAPQTTVPPTAAPKTTASQTTATPDVLALLALRQAAAPAAGPKAATLDSATSTTYTVQPGDTLWGIAQQFYSNADWTKIWDANMATIGSNPGLIQPGMTLTIPGANYVSGSGSQSISAAEGMEPDGAWSIFAMPDGDEVAVGYADALLTKLGAPETPGDQQFVYDWELSEGSGADNNPLNGGDYDGLATSGTQYGGGANDYLSLSINVNAMAGILTSNPQYGYDGIVTALQDNDPSAAETALFDSSWAASHYGYGTSFSAASLPSGTPASIS